MPVFTQFVVTDFEDDQNVLCVIIFFLPIAFMRMHALMAACFTWYVLLVHFQLVAFGTIE